MGQGDTPTTGGRIILFSTSLTRASAITPNYLVYAATKGAIDQMTRVLAKDLGARGITVNTVSPGPIDTDMFREGKPEQLINLIANQHPQKRIGQPDEVSPVVSFLASEQASWVNGQNLMVNGVNHIPTSSYLCSSELIVSLIVYRATLFNCEVFVLYFFIVGCILGPREGRVHTF